MKVSVALALLSLLSAVGQCSEPLAWPRFRGPGGSGVADDQQPPLEFGPGRNVKWQVAAPGGLSSPIVVGDLLVITAFEGGKLYTIAYARADGSEAWRAAAPADEIERYNEAEGSPAASTPATDGRRIVSYFGSCGLVCYDLAGRELWRFELPPPVLAGNFGSGVSPVLADGTVVLVRDGARDARILALDVDTGDLKWERERQSPVSYCTPVVWETAAGLQVAAAGHGRMIGYDLGTGEEQWTVAGMPTGCCASPVTADGLLLFAGWSPGGPDDSGFQMPTFDELLGNLDADRDNMLSRAEAAGAFAGFFESQDANGDGRITRDEHEAMLKLMAEGRSSAFALRAGGRGDVTESHVIWRQTKGLPYVPSGIAYRGQYVMVKDGGIVTAFDAATGDQVYMARAVEEGRYYSSPVAASGNIYFTCLDNGAVTVLKAGSETAEVVARNTALGERVAATPAIADDTLYVRSARRLYAFAEPDE